MVYHELLKPGETVNADRYRQQMINLDDALIEKPDQNWPQNKTGSGYNQSTWLGAITPAAVFTRLGSLNCQKGGQNV